MTYAKKAVTDFQKTHIDYEQVTKFNLPIFARGPFMLSEDDSIGVIYATLRMQLYIHEAERANPNNRSVVMG